MIVQDELVPAHTPAPGEILSAELAARGWSQRQFAFVIGKPVQAVNEIIQAKKQITPDTALHIAAALGTSAELWFGLKADYRFAVARQRVPEQVLREIAQRSQQSTLESVEIQ
jgi:HTH-type transcriptional regulator / antitoxin HigA